MGADVEDAARVEASNFSEANQRFGHVGVLGRSNSSGAEGDAPYDERQDSPSRRRPNSSIRAMAAASVEQHVNRGVGFTRMPRRTGSCHDEEFPANAAMY